MTQTTRQPPTDCRFQPQTLITWAGFTDWMQQFNLQDVLTSYRHSKDFNGSRAEYIHSRVRPLALIFALLMPLWLPLDYLILPPAEFQILVGLRVGASLAFLLIGWCWGHTYLLWLAHLRLALLIAVPLVFYLSARMLLENQVESGLLVGYTFFPYIVVAMQSVFPLTILEGVLYVLSVWVVDACLYWYSGTLFNFASLGNLWLLALLAGIALWAETAQLYMLLRLYRQATRDALTGLVNRRVLTDALEKELLRIRRYRYPLTIMLMDLDRFKRINDTYGHLTGDAVLQTFAALLDRELRQTDLVGRYGGEEFLAILSGTDLHSAGKVAERVRAQCHVHPAHGPNHTTVEFTTSIGLAELREGENVESLLGRVDEALYNAKAKGRDRVVLAED